MSFLSIMRLDKILLFELKNNTTNSLQRQTKIPVPLWNRLKNGKPVQFSEKTIDRIFNNYFDKAVSKLHDKGVPIREAAHYVDNYTPTQVRDIEHNAANVARKIWKYKVRDYNVRMKTGRTRGEDGKPLVKPLLKHIVKGLQKSSKILSDWIELLVSYGKRKAK